MYHIEELYAQRDAFARHAMVDGIDESLREQLIREMRWYEKAIVLACNAAFALLRVEG